MPIDLITVPYDSGHVGMRMGAGPLAFAEAGAAERLRVVAGSVRETAVGVKPELAAEIATAFDLARATAFAVRTALGRGSLPLVLAGNCISAVGTLAALSPGTGVVWLDAHGDLNTPETTASGMLDGMALATVLGLCWRGMTARIDGFTPVAEENVLLAGARDLDEAEQRFLDRSPVLVLAADAAADGQAAASRIEALAARVQRVYLHVDLDVHAPEAGRANGFQPAGGMSADAVRRFVRDLAARIPIAAAAITAYDPAVDVDGRMLAVGLELMETIGEVAARDDAEV